MTCILTDENMHTADDCTMHDHECKRCGSTLSADGLCPDETCPYDTRPQDAEWTEE